jgi:hypothetical protein
MSKPFSRSSLPNSGSRKPNAGRSLLKVGKGSGIGVAAGAAAWESGWGGLPRLPRLPHCSPAGVLSPYGHCLITLFGPHADEGRFPAASTSSHTPASPDSSTWLMNFDRPARCGQSFGRVPQTYILLASAAWRCSGSSGRAARPVPRPPRRHSDRGRRQNRRSQTLAAPDSVRLVQGAGVSTPLARREVKRGLNPAKFTIRTLDRRLSEVGDRWRPTLGGGVGLEDASDGPCGWADGPARSRLPISYTTGRIRCSACSRVTPPSRC